MAKNNHTVDIAVIKKDLGYMKESLDNTNVEIKEIKKVLTHPEGTLMRLQDNTMKHDKHIALLWKVLISSGGILGGLITIFAALK